MELKQVAVELRTMAKSIAKLIQAIEAETNISLSGMSKEEQDCLINENRCLICKKTLGKKIVRGCHEYCQRSAKDAYSETELENAGLLLPVKNAGRKPNLINSIQSSLELAKEAKALADKTFGRDKKKKGTSE
jgi:hypothetical protein